MVKWALSGCGVGEAVLQEPGPYMDAKLDAVHFFLLLFFGWSRCAKYLCYQLEASIKKYLSTSSLVFINKNNAINGH